MLSEAGGTSYLVPGPNRPGNAFQDTSEPYSWRVDFSTTSLKTWVQALGTGNVTLTIADPLLLPDFDTGLTTDVLALIDAGEPADVFAQAPRTASGTLVDGEVGIGSSNEPITRLRNLDDGNRWAINDSGPLNLGTYFGPGGDGNELTVYVQTVAGLASWTVADNIQSSSASAIAFAVPEDQRAITSSIVEHTRFAFALGSISVTE